MLARRACLRVADSGVLLPGAEDMGILVHQGRLSNADSGVLHPEALPGLVVPRECVGVEDVLGMGDIGALSLSSPDPVGVLVRHMGGFDVDVDVDVDVLGSGLPLRIRLRMERRCCKVRGGDLCGSSSGNSKESSDNAAFSAKEECHSCPGTNTFRKVLTRLFIGIYKNRFFVNETFQCKSKFLVTEMKVKTLDMTRKRFVLEDVHREKTRTITFGCLNLVHDSFQTRIFLIPRWKTSKRR